MQEIELSGLNEKIYCDECSNGLKVYMWVKKDVSSYYATLSIKYGSIYNKFKIQNKTYELPHGVAHFLEHLKFYEGKDKTAHDFYFATGSDANAFTTFHYTNYQVLGSTNAKENILHLLDFVQNDYFTKPLVSNEKKIIISEAQMGEDDPYTVMLFKHLDNLFNSYDHKYPITGTPKDVKEITIDDIKLAFNSFYHPQNSFLVVTGNFNPYELMEAIKNNQNKKDFKEYSNPKRIIKREDAKVNVPYEEININVTNKKIKIGFKIPKNNFKNYDNLHIKILMSIILKANFGATSDFKDELLEKEIISDISYSTDIFDECVVVMFTIDSDLTEEVINKFQEKLKDLSMPEKTFNRIKRANIASLILEFEDVETVNTLIQTDILSYGGIIPNLKEIYEEITYEDLKEFLKYVKTDEQSVLVLKPLDDEQ